jgi:serine/threonine-protein kinase
MGPSTSVSRATTTEDAATGGAGTTAMSNPTTEPAPTTGPDTAAPAWSAGQIAFGPDGRLYGTDCELARVFRFTPSGVAKEFAGSGPGGFSNGFSGDGGPARAAHFGCPIGIVFDADGNAFLTDHLNNRIREIDHRGTIETVVGTGRGAYGGDGGPATDASLLGPSCLAIGPDGALYICDRDDGTVRRVGADGVITTVAGTGERGYSGDGGPATRAKLDQPEGLAFDTDGNLYISDSANDRVREVDADGTISTFAGDGKDGNEGEDVPATTGAVDDPNGLAFDANGNLYVSAVDAHVLRRIDPDGIITTFAGTGEPGAEGDGGPASEATLTSPFGLVFDSMGNLYVADPDAHVIRVIAPDGTISTFAAAPDAA